MHRNGVTEISGPLSLWRTVRKLFNFRLLAILLVCLCAIEMALRFVMPQLVNQVHTATLSGGHLIERTPKGFRIVPGSDVPNAPFHVLALGDSTTFGTGVAAEATWPLAVAGYLDGQAVVDNAGVQGGGIHDIAAILETVSATDPAEVVVLLVTANMISFTDFRWDASLRSLPMQENVEVETSLIQILRKKIGGMALYKAAIVQTEYVKYGLGLLDHRVRFNERPRSPLMAYGWTQPDIPSGLHDRMWFRFERTFEQMKDRLALQNRCLVVGFLPPRFMLSDHRLDNLKFVPKDRLPEEAETRIASLAETYDLPYVDSAGALRQKRASSGPLSSPLYVVGDYAHLDAEGHAVVAESFASVIGPILQGDRECSYTD